MNTLTLIILIFIGVYILMGPIMLGVAKLNKFDPYILEKTEEEIMKDEKSFIMVNILRPMLFPLWMETKLIRWIKRVFSK